jgi:hypothetical protein
MQQRRAILIALYEQERLASSTPTPGYEPPDEAMLHATLEGMGISEGGLRSVVDDVTSLLAAGYLEVIAGASRGHFRAVRVDSETSSFGRRPGSLKHTLSWVLFADPTRSERTAATERSILVS